MAQNTRLFVISGPSGAGKGTLVSRLRERHPSLALTVSATTRAPRPGDQDGITYHFLSTSTFEELIDSGEFLEWASVHDNYYGTLRSEMQRCFAAGQSVCLEIDPQGAFQVKEQEPTAILIFIAPPNMDELERRLRMRGTETEDQIVRRLDNARHELQLASSYDKVIVNDDLETALNELEAFVTACENEQPAQL